MGNIHIDYLKGKDHISVVQLQKDRSCTYAQARALLNTYIKLYLVAEKPQGLLYELNTGYLNPKELSREECQKAKAMIGDNERSLLEMFARWDGESELQGLSRSMMEKYKGELDYLEASGLIHRFRDQYFLSITRKSCEEICSDYDLISVTNSGWITHVARPIVEGCTKYGRYPNRLLVLECIPDFCKEYIIDTLTEYFSTSVLPKLEIGRPDGFSVKLLRFDLLENLIRACDFDTKEEYVDAVERNAEVIMRSKVCPQVLKDAAESAAKHIKEELTLDNIKEIRRIILDE